MSQSTYLYPSAIQQSNLGYEQLLEQYINNGYTYQSISDNLKKHHGIVSSSRSVRRHAKVLKLCKRKYKYNIINVTSIIRKEILNSSPNCGYRYYWQKLRTHYSIHIRKNTVCQIVKYLDPEGVERRKRHQFKKRKFIVHEPNELWSLDGYDKLKKFGKSKVKLY